MIQQIEDLNKNIRYCESTTNNIFNGEDEIEENEVSNSLKTKLNQQAKRKPNVLRGNIRGLDIILDEEEEAD